MVSLGRSGLTLLSISRSSFALLSSNSKSISTRQSFLTTTGLVTAASMVGISTSTFVTTSSFLACEAANQGPMSSSRNNEIATGYLNAADAAALDAELMSSPGFSLEQLMELAGLAVAEAVYQVLPPSQGIRPRIMLVCGPGNNGGDGLVAARHLVMFGYDCVVVYPKRSKGQHFINLVQQCRDVGIDILEELPSDFLGESKAYDAIVDAIFGFSFSGEPREPFATILTQMQRVQSQLGIPILSVDVPSGWNVDQGDVRGSGFLPEVLISLTTPKESARNFQGRHFCGGRFLPPALAEKYNVRVRRHKQIVPDLLPSVRTKSSWNWQLTQLHEIFRLLDALDAALSWCESSHGDYQLKTTTR